MLVLGMGAVVGLLVSKVREMVVVAVTTLLRLGELGDGVDLEEGVEGAWVASSSVSEEAMGVPAVISV